MPDVYAVEVSDGQSAWAKMTSRILERTEDRGAHESLPASLRRITPTNEDFQAVVSHMYIRRQTPFRRRMHQVMRNVREECPLRLQSADRLQRLFDRGMRRVRIVAQSVEKQNIQAHQQRFAFRRNLTMVGKIGAIAEAKAVNSALAMESANRLDASAGHQNRLAIEDVRSQTRTARLRWRCIEYVAKSALDHFPGARLKHRTECRPSA